MRSILTSTIWVVTILSIFALYAIKYDTRQLEIRVREMERLADRTNDEIAVLQAEWGHLTQPERVDKLARKHLGYGPIVPSQFATLEEIIQASRIASGTASRREGASQ